MFIKCEDANYHNYEMQKKIIIISFVKGALIKGCLMTNMLEIWL